MSERPHEETRQHPPTRRPAIPLLIGLLVGLCALIGVVLFAIGMAQMR